LFGGGRLNLIHPPWTLLVFTFQFRTSDTSCHVSSSFKNIFTRQTITLRYDITFSSISYVSWCNIYVFFRLCCVCSFHESRSLPFVICVCKLCGFSYGPFVCWLSTLKKNWFELLLLLALALVVVVVPLQPPPPRQVCLHIPICTHVTDVLYLHKGVCITNSFLQLKLASLSHTLSLSEFNVAPL
jgi:hypothetical protein